MAESLRRLRERYVASGKAELFDALRPALVGESGRLPHRELGKRLNLSEGAVKVSLYRLRRRYHGLLREQLEQTLAPGADVEEEMAWLQSVLTA